MNTGAWYELLRPIADVGLVYITFLYLLRLVRGTKTGAVMIGILVVLAAWLATRQLGLFATATLLGAFIDSVVIIIVVVFQADIRRALAGVGRSPGAWGRGLDREGTIPELVAAASRLAAQKVGALIVVERSAELDDRLEGAAVIDALLSRQLLQSIFQHESPLHDGAVVIRDERVLVAGYFMPLALEGRIAEGLGTRHRAALGLTADVDSVVIVVSEERGEISLALGGELERNLGADELASRLRELLGTKEQSETALSRFVHWMGVR